MFKWTYFFYKHHKYILYTVVSWLVYKWSRLDLYRVSMYQQIQGLNTEEKGLEISKIWRWIVQNATLMSFEQLCRSDSVLYIFGVNKNTYICIIFVFHILSKIVVFGTRSPRTVTHWAKHFGKCSLTLYGFTKFANFVYFCVACGNATTFVPKMVAISARNTKHKSIQNLQICKAIFSAFYNISQPNLVILLILVCSF